LKEGIVPDDMAVSMSCDELRNYGEIRMQKGRIEALKSVRANVQARVLEHARAGLTSYTIRVGTRASATLGLHVLYRELNDIEHLITEEREMVLEMLQALLVPVYPDARILINYPPDNDHLAKINGPSLVIDWS